MKIYVYPADMYGCGYYRLIWIALALKKEGHDIEIVPPGGKDAMGNPVKGANLQGQMDKDGNTVRVNYPHDADALVMQRITHKALSQGFPLWRKSGIAVIMDLDDDLETIHPANQAWAALHPNRGKPGFDWKAARYAADNATMVTVSTPALAERYGRHGRVKVLRNCVPEAYLNIPHEDSDVFGWGGSVGSHPDDLQMAASGVRRLTREGTHFRVVGPPNGVEGALGIDTNWSASGTVGIHDWPAQLSKDLGIGIAPLADTKFNQAKSWLKPLEYAALGIPAVMSPRDEYVELNKLGVGVLANKPKDWYRECGALAKSRDLRQELSGKGRDIASVLTVEKNAWLWAEAWVEAIEFERKRRPAHAVA